MAISCGADDVGVISLNRPELAQDRAFVLQAMPSTKSVICIVKKMNQEPIRSTKRSLANKEFHGVSDQISEIGRELASRLTSMGIAALNTDPGFPMELADFPGRTWIISHKLVAEAAGLGKMGIHRNIIHPIFGNFILLNSILVDCEISDESQPIDYNPCLECKLCVAACPVGAIAPDNHFDAVACLNHNYREFMGGFVDWVDTVTDSKTRSQYQSRVTDQETASLWQSLALGPQYKSAYCMAVCPAGDDIIGRFLTNKAKFVRETLNPLQQKSEPVYVVPGSDAEAHVLKRFPNKTVRRIASGIRPSSIRQLIGAMPLAFQRGQSKGIEMTYHFTFTGAEPQKVTFLISNQTLTITESLVGEPNLRVTVASDAWIDFLAKRVGLAKMVMTRKLRFSGDLRLLALFGRCFPS